MSQAGSGSRTFAAPGIVALTAHRIPGDVTHCDHDRVPGGREDICVIVALVVLGELLGEELAGELEEEAEGRLRSPPPPPAAWGSPGLAWSLQLAAPGGEARPQGPQCRGFS